MTGMVNDYAALERNEPITPWSYAQRDPRPGDVAFNVLFCGVCHTDLHMIGTCGRDFPIVPGHEMVGRVTEVGAEVGLLRTRSASGLRVTGL
jgi:alcohol dehydrogenase (NADP+)